MKRATIAGLLIIILLAPALSLAQTPNIHDTSTYPIILGAHRGSSVKHTENTLDAIREAVQDPRYKFIEFDIQYTKDKKIIVFHDKTLFRLQWKFGDIENLTYKELLEISDFYIPEYHEVMDLVSNSKPLNIEIKSQDKIKDDKQLIDFVIHDCKTRNILDQILISSISSDVVQYVSDNYPELPTGKIYWIHPVTYIPSEDLVKEFYEEMNEIGADYIMLHGINMHNYDLLIEHKPDNQTLVFWYFNDQMYLIQKDKCDTLW